MKIKFLKFFKLLWWWGFIVCFVSKGAGDLNIKVECMNLQETCSIQDYLFVPTLDSNRQFYQMAGTTTISNNEMSGGSAKLLPAFDNSGNWELTFKVKFSGNNCCALLIPPTETTRDTNELLVTAYKNAISWYNNGTITQNLQGHHLSANTYYNVTITKNGSSISVSIGNNSKTTTAWNSVSASNLQIGVGGWGSSGKVCTIKEIVVKPL